MQVVRVKFVTHYNDVQEAVDRVSQMLPNLGGETVRCRGCSASWTVRHGGENLESWDIYSVDETVVAKVSHPVADGKVMKNHG